MWARRPGPAAHEQSYGSAPALYNGLAKAAGEGLAHVTHHLEAAWHVVEARSDAAPIRRKVPPQFGQQQAPGWTISSRAGVQARGAIAAHAE